ncbi:unnamed protein product [Parnassius mnemosyne]|uniref:CBF1-interacting co-repressor CIR N-terminal domain-containing protein n=1 Tax=Parnassius mnemosyne TaxID=213953 RepID=A0AAV1KSV8_9NEOP
MNILPKKRWHVRTKDNIARVRKDEAEAAEKERQEKLRIEVADREARLKLLKQKSKERLQAPDTIVFQETLSAVKPEHINLFADLEHAVTTTNKDHDLEEKKKKEEYEKKIGYLTYLGQDTNEALKKKNWYEVPPEASRFSRCSDIKDTYDKLVLKDQDGKPKKRELDIKDGEVCWEAKKKLDPINSFKKLCSQKCKTENENNLNDLSEVNDKKMFKEHKIIKKKKRELDHENKMQKLREARLKREQQERYKTEMYLKKLSGSETPIEEQPKQSKIKPKYNSQFNPELARQNYF